ncbi:MAG: CBS domain-containing protein [Phycisphaerales bacterium]|nr:CBS domain-containing protein [Phycisphaerales bacterium]
MPTVQDILKKQGEVAITNEDTMVIAAAKMMSERRIGALVVARGDKVVGIFTERDVLNRVVAEHRNPATTRVGEVMTSPVACCKSTSPVAECRSVMTEKRIRHLPVVDDGRLVGMLSSGDILAMENRQQQETIEYLHEYLHSGTR